MVSFHFKIVPEPYFRSPSCAQLSSQGRTYLKLSDFEELTTRLDPGAVWRLLSRWPRLSLHLGFNVPAELLRHLRGSLNKVSGGGSWRGILSQLLYARQVHQLDLHCAHRDRVCLEAALSLPGLECLHYAVLDQDPPTEQSMEWLLRRLETFAAHCGQLRQLRVAGGAGCLAPGTQHAPAAPVLGYRQAAGLLHRP